MDEIRDPEIGRLLSGGSVAEHEDGYWDALREAVAPELEALEPETIAVPRPRRRRLLRLGLAAAAVAAAAVVAFAVLPALRGTDAATAADMLASMNAAATERGPRRAPLGQGGHARRHAVRFAIDRRRRGVCKRAWRNAGAAHPQHVGRRPLGDQGKTRDDLLDSGRAAPHDDVARRRDAGRRRQQRARHRAPELGREHLRDLALRRTCRRLRPPCARSSRRATPTRR